MVCMHVCIYDVCILNFISAAPPAMGLGTNLGQPTGFGSAFGNQTGLFTIQVQEVYLEPPTLIQVGIWNLQISFNVNVDFILDIH